MHQDQTLAVPRPPQPPRPPGRPGARRWAGLAAGAVLLAFALVASIAVGARPIPLGVVWDLFWDPDGSELSVTIHDLRVPRTLLGLVVGVALGVAGAVMQALTRNPLADPGLFGVNAGAALAVVAGVALLGVDQPAGYVWFAMAGAGLAATLVYLLGSAGRSASPMRLALAGVAVAAVIHAVVHGFTTLNATIYNEIRFWLVGTFSGRDLAVVATIAPIVGAGVLIAVVMSPALNVLALGEDTGRALGVRPGRARALGALAVLLLCGAATAGAGPIMFVGLAVPHMVRFFSGPDQRWLLVFSAIWAPVLLLAADVLGRVVARPDEVPVGIVMAFVGAPVFIALLRRRKVIS